MTLMQKAVFLVGIIILLGSCQKEYLVPAREVPEWLKERIAADEQVIQEDPTLMAGYGAWMRYQFRGDMYYEYINLLSSKYPDTFNESGQEVNLVDEPYLDYWDDKCCGTYIWRGPGYQSIS